MQILNLMASLHDWVWNGHVRLGFGYMCHRQIDDGAGGKAFCFEMVIFWVDIVDHHSGCYVDGNLASRRLGSRWTSRVSRKDL